MAVALDLDEWEYEIQIPPRPWSSLGCLGRVTQPNVPCTVVVQLKPHNGILWRKSKITTEQYQQQKIAHHMVEGNACSMSKWDTTSVLVPLFKNKYGGGTDNWSRGDRRKKTFYKSFMERFLFKNNQATVMTFQGLTSWNTFRLMQPEPGVLLLSKQSSVLNRNCSFLTSVGEKGMAKEQFRLRLVLLNAFKFQD